MFMTPSVHGATLRLVVTPVAPRQSKFIARALLVWLILIATEFVHGILRAIFLVPVVGDFRARQIGVFIGSALILLVAYLLSAGFVRRIPSR
jgi:hypothetical protein